MFRAFIIDDDRFAVEATCKMFPWQELNVTQIEKIYSPIGLTERILAEQPQLVFIDIEMGSISGLDIMRRCKEEGSEALFIIISGHDNFDYAHTAVNLGAVYYLLKPIDFADVQKVTVKLKHFLAQQTPKNEISDRLLTKDSLETFLAGQPADGDYRFMVCVASAAVAEQLTTLLLGALADTYKIGEKKYLFLLKADNLTEGMQAALRQYAVSQKLVLGVSSRFDKSNRMYDYFSQANLLSYQLFIEPSGDLLFWNSDADTGLLAQLSDEIFGAIDAKNPAWIDDILKRLPVIFVQHRYTMHHVVWFYNTLIGRIHLTLNREFPFSQMDEEDLQMYFQNLRELCSSLQTYIHEAIEPQKNNREETNGLWNDILAYIELNYAKKIRAQDICSELFISSTTLYNAFKINTNGTFIEYLTCFRLEKAKQLLQLSPKAIPQIAEAVGIKDHYYFNKIFKKYTGLSPSSWRELNREGNEKRNESQITASEN